jgi:hypothetical protein
MKLTRRHTGDGRYFCAICNEPVVLQRAKYDEDGKAVHEECYLKKISGLIPPKLRKAPAKQA